MVVIQLTEQPIDVAAIQAAIGDDDCGAQLVFCGCTRRTTGAKVTTLLRYEAYAVMAERELKSLADQAVEQFGLKRAYLAHRLGIVPIGEASIVIGLAAPHRASVFAAVSWLMDRIKAEVPIWKEEHWADGGQEWIHGQS